MAAFSLVREDVRDCWGGVASGRERVVGTVPAAERVVRRRVVAVVAAASAASLGGWPKLGQVPLPSGTS